MSEALLGRELIELTSALNHEADLLDSGELAEWLELMTDDVTYQVPVRVTRERGERPDVSPDMAYYSDDLETLRLRVARLGTEYAWAEDPPSRTRHFVTNVMVRATDVDDEYSVRSNILVFRSRASLAQPELLAGQRHDRWRRTSAGWRMAHRTVTLDQVNIGTPNLAIFL